MKTTGKCPKCKSTDIIANAKAIDQGDYNAQQDFSLVTFGKPEAWLFKEPRKTTVSAWVCAACGYTEFYADLPEALKQPKD